MWGSRDSGGSVTRRAVAERSADLDRAAQIPVFGTGKGAGGQVKTAISICILIAAAVVTFTLVSGGLISGGRVMATAKAPSIATEDYGKRLLGNTPEYLGPDVANQKMRYTSSRLSCGSCHLGVGTEPGTLSLPAAFHHYPRFSPRYGYSTTIEDRVNECMQRSMNGKPLPKNSPEMIAMASYIPSLSDRDAATAPTHKNPPHPPHFNPPNPPP